MELAGFTYAQGARIWQAVLRFEQLATGDPRLDGGVFDGGEWTAINSSGEEWPSCGVGQLISTTNVGNRPITTGDLVADLFGVAGPIVVATPRATADGDRTTLQPGPLVRAATDGSTITPGGRWSPQVGDWTLTPDPFGQFVAIGEDPLDDVGVFWQLPTPELIRRAKPDANISAGSSGTCSLWANGSDTGENVTASYNWATDGVTLLAGIEGWVRFDLTAGEWEWIGGGCEV